MHRPLTIAMGKDIAGNPVVADLAKIPVCWWPAPPARVNRWHQRHDLVVAVQVDPKQVRLMLIDPKMLELSVYEGIPHLIAPVVNDMRHAAHALNWGVGEMDRRYKLMCARRAQSGRL